MTIGCLIAHYSTSLSAMSALPISLAGAITGWSGYTLRKSNSMKRKFPSVLVQAVVVLSIILLIFALSRFPEPMLKSAYRSWYFLGPAWLIFIFLLLSGYKKDRSPRYSWFGRRGSYRPQHDVE